MDTLGVAGRAVRTLVTVAVAGLLLLGSGWGSDDHFPFGPLLMYAEARGLDEPIADTQAFGVDTAGARLRLDQSLTGLRRAEIEGQLARFVEAPSLLRFVAEAYARRNPSAPPLRRVTIIITWHEMRNGVVTGASSDERVTTWRRR
jgi:hypothetical protein